MRKSYFDPDVLERKMARLREEDRCEPWLISALETLKRNVDRIPVEEDENRYVVEFIYPH